jgi:hypothetical protein
MPISSPTASALGADLGFGGDMLTKQRQDEEEELRRRRKLGLSPAANGSPTVKALLGGLSGMGGPNFNIGGLR